jgi:hypothetical protein
MKSRETTIINNGIRESAVIEYAGGKPTLTLLLNNGERKSYSTGPVQPLWFNPS